MAEPEIAHGPTLVAPSRDPAGDHPDRLAAGVHAGDYVIERFLGAGAMGDVYAGRHPIIGKRVAIKVLKRELASEPEAAERFVREAKAVNQIDHPNVIDVFGFGRLPAGDGRLYLVMDLVEGQSLRKAIQDGALPIDGALEVLAQIADALDAAHARGVIHRDLKPDNVMLTDATPPKALVLDFGIAKLVTAGVTGNGTLTGKGTWLGTPGYMAPEQWAADGAGPASDRYALGVMAYEMLSGTLPFQAATLPQMMEQHFRAPVPALSMHTGPAGQRAPERGKLAYQRTLDPVLARAMAKSPDARFATARELVDALRAAAGGKPTRTARRSRSMVAPAAAGIGVLALVVVGFVVVRDGKDPSVDAPRASASRISDGFVRIQVITQPAAATVMRDDKLVGSSPATLEVRPGAPLTIRITKPGYRPIVEVITPAMLILTKDVLVRRDLQAITGFEGVWAMPSGQLRAFQRVGESIEVYKLATVTGEREFWRRFELVEPTAPGEVVFAISTELTDERGVRDPSCQIAHRVEYHFDPASELLDVRAERVETARQNGRCIVRTRLPGLPIQLARADRETGDTRWTQPPVGKPAPLPPVSDRKPPPNRANKDVAAREDRTPAQTVRPKLPPTEGLNVGNEPPTQAQPAPQAQQAPQTQEVLPRGDSQVAPLPPKGDSEQRGRPPAVQKN